MKKIGNITLISTFQLTIVKYSQENDKLIDASEEIWLFWQWSYFHSFGVSWREIFFAQSCFT